MKTSAATVMLGAALVAVGVAAGIVGGAVSAPAVEGLAVVKNRLAVMKQHSNDLRTIQAYLDGKADLATAQAAGADLSRSLGELPTLFPEATGMVQYPGESGAKPTIWTDWNTFMADVQSAVTKADALNAALKGGEKNAVRTALGDLGKNGCVGCHQTFREKI